MRVALIYGGSSSEREVSLKTGAAVINGLRSLDMDVKPYDIPEEEVITVLPELKKSDIVYIGYHGGYGEDGRVQALLEMAGIPFTGSDSISSRLAMEKRLAKILFERSNIPTPKWFSQDASYISQEVMEKAINLGLPLAVKPAEEGSTFGFTKVLDLKALPRAIDKALKYDDEIIIESFIEGQELTVSFLAGEALPPVLIKPIDGLYDYKHKYTKGTTEYICPAPLPQSVNDELMKLAERAFASLGCRNYGRVDFRLDKDNNPYCLEVNTLPGMTALSLVPMAAKAKNYDFPELIKRIILDALTYFE